MNIKMICTLFYVDLYSFSYNLKNLYFVYYHNV